MALATGATEGAQGGGVGGGVAGFGRGDCLGGGRLAGVDDCGEGLPVFPDRGERLAVADDGAFGEERRNVGLIGEDHVERLSGFGPREAIERAHQSAVFAH